MKYFVKTFGCQQNKADSERISAQYEARGMQRSLSYKKADYVIINTCMVRESAENRVYGLVKNLGKLKLEKKSLKVIVTGCMVGLAFRDPSGKYLQRLKSIMPSVDEFLPIEEVGFDHHPVRVDSESAWVPISNGCNNFCTFCIVPMTRGREISRPYEDIIRECQNLKEKGYKKITLLGMNVNSYGADLVVGEKNIQVMRDLPKTYFTSSVVSNGVKRSENSHTSVKEISRSARDDIGMEYKFNGKTIKPVYVKHLGRQRIPTLFPSLLSDVASMGFEHVDFVSSNPWDFSDDLIEVISQHPNITRTLHFALQSGDDGVLKRMNRWYTSDEYLDLLTRIRDKVPSIRFTTDIIVGFCGETDEEFENTVELCKKADFDWAYVSMYSLRPMTAATKVFKDDIPHSVKRRRWQILDDLINKPALMRRRQLDKTHENSHVN